VNWHRSAPLEAKLVEIGDIGFLPEYQLHARANAAKRSDLLPTRDTTQKTTNRK
jgi:hypothetical protein